jgi:hypothetical protein
MAGEHVDPAGTVDVASARVPAALRARMESAVQRQLGATLPMSEHPGLEAVDAAILGEAGLACLEDALAAGDARSGAFALLAADALITAACGAAATTELPTALSLRRFTALLER